MSRIEGGIQRALIGALHNLEASLFKRFDDRESDLFVAIHEDSRSTERLPDERSDRTCNHPDWIFGCH